MNSLSTKMQSIASKCFSDGKLWSYVGGSIISFLAPITTLIGWIIVFSIVDFITGVSARVTEWNRMSDAQKATEKQCLSSNKFRESIIKGVLYITFILLLHGLDKHILCSSLELSFARVGTMIVCGVELYSILENMYRITRARVFRVLTTWTTNTIQTHTGVDITNIDDVDSTARNTKIGITSSKGINNVNKDKK